MSDTDHKDAASAWLAEIEGHLWAMRPEALHILCAHAASGHIPVSAEQIEAARSRGRPRSIHGGVARVPLKGVLMPLGGFLALLFGDYNPLDSFLSSLHEAHGDDEVGAIVIEVDSPGGVVDGIPEAAAAVRALRGQGKPIIAVANTLAASAAYWIASQADEVVVTPSGAVGSIGVYATHRNMSGALEMMGVETTLISAGKFKTEGNPYEPLSDDAKEAIQQDVDDFYGMFVADVAKGRGAKATEVKGGYGEGRVLNAKRALSDKLVDRVETLGETVARLSSRSRGGGVARAEVEKTGAELEAASSEAGAEADAGADGQHEPDMSDQKARALLSLNTDRAPATV